MDSPGFDERWKWVSEQGEESHNHGTNGNRDPDFPLGLKASVRVVQHCEFYRH